MDRLDGLPRRELRDGLVVIEASTRRSRRRGLARLDALEPGHAMLFARCRSIHTVGMRFALDLVWLGRDGTTVRVDRGVGPRRLKTCLRARAVVECNADEADRFLAAGM